MFQPIQNLIMNPSETIVGVSRTLQDIGQSSQWNKKLLTWLITHHTPNSTRQHCIELEMKLISSERIVRVDGEVKHRAMVSFGFKAEFGISATLKGAIEQQAFSFQLFVNGRSFSDLTKVQYAYQPPKLQIATSKPESIGSIPKVEKNSITAKQEYKASVSQAAQPKPPFEFKSNDLEKKKSVEESLKDSQDQLLRIMIEEKRKKKLSQQQSK